VTAFEKHEDVVNGFAVSFLGGKARDARPEASLYVVLKAWARMIAREIDCAGRNEEVPVYEIGDAVGKIGGEVGSKV
jgi:hypothetical protein